MTSLVRRCAVLPLTLTSAFAVAQPSAVRFNANFEGGALGRVEQVAPDHYLCAVPGQQDQQGRNRQASWFYFRVDGARGRDLTLTLHDFVGEYNGKPGAVPMTADTVPVVSDDGETWVHVPSMEWDAKAKEATLRLRPAGDSIWVARLVPYTTRHLAGLLDEVGKSTHVLVEVVGKTAGGRDLPVVTVTNPATPDAGKRTVWLVARQHAWESGTSHVMDGAVRFAASDDDRARRLRDRAVMRFLPMADPDGSAAGTVRFNANGYDLNRNWAGDPLPAKDRLRLMPEIWYARKAIAADMRGRGIDLLVNLHNTETGEYLQTAADDEAVLSRMRVFAEALTAGSSFDPSSPGVQVGATSTDTLNSLWAEHKVPAMLMEQRVATGKKLGRRPTVEDRRAFGRELIAAMAETALRHLPRTQTK